MLSRKILFLQELKELLKVCHDSDDESFNVNDDSEIQRFISKVNSAISPFHMRLKAGVSEADGKRFYALINLKDDELSRCATMFKGDEMKYYKKLVHKIVESENGSMSSTEALNLADNVDGCRLQLRTAQELIDRWLELGCLSQEGGKLSLSPLSLCEMEPYLQQQFGDELKKCQMCKQICLQGHICSNASCGIKMHHHCAEQFFRASATEACPKCHQPS